MSAFEYFDERRLRPCIERDRRPRIDRVGRSLIAEMHERDRLGELYLARDRNCTSGRAQRLVESRQGIVDRIRRDRRPSAMETPAGRRSESSAINRPPSKTICVPAAKRSRPASPRRAASMSARVGGGQDRRRIGHRGAQIGIVPSLDAPGRQSGRGEPREGGGASGRRLTPFLLGELPGKRPFGGRSTDDMRGHRRITQPPPRNRDNHCARAQARVQGRRWRQSGPWPSRARHPA